MNFKGNSRIGQSLTQDHFSLVSEDRVARQMHGAQIRPVLNNGLDTLSGAGIIIAIGDDGFIGPHIDLQNRLDQSLADQVGVDHEDMVAGILIGAGNLDPKTKGIAPGATLVACDNFEAILLADDLVNDFGVSISSTSKGDGCNTSYTFRAREADQSARQKPFLSHVFSAGNAAEVGCGHPVGPPWYTITGGIKQNKSSISVGNLNTDLMLVPTSSRGPAYDGRIKPELVALGDGQRTTSENNAYQISGGTSAAAPTVAGQLALLYEGYIKQVGQLPDNALIKAVLLNTAIDLGPSGPDFEYGFGWPQVNRAWDVIQSEQYSSSFLNQGDLHRDTIDVTDLTNQLQFFLCWTDREADLGASKALVNDLDLRVIGPDGSIHFPLVLDPSDASLISGALAVPGIDSLNPIEQVRIVDPLPGEYIVEILGVEIPSGQQEAHWTWYSSPEPLSWISDLEGLAFEPEDTIRLFWENRTNSSSTDIEWQVWGSNDWQNLAVGLPNQFWDWGLPENLSGRFRFRLKSGNETSTSSGWFWVAESPKNLQVVEACPDSTIWSWTSQSPGTQYFIFQLQDRYMTLVDSTFADSIVLSNENLDTNWVALRSKNPDGDWSPRGIAVSRTGTINCPITATNQQEAIQAITLMPNPSTGLFQVNHLPERGNWELIDQTGKCLDAGQWNTSTYQWQVNHLPKGIYFLRLRSSSLQETLKVMLL